jgi:hypothetical protein
VVLAMPPAGDGLAYATIIDSALLRGATVVAVSAHGLTMAAATHHGTVLVVPKDGGIAVPESLRAITVG